VRLRRGSRSIGKRDEGRRLKDGVLGTKDSLTFFFLNSGCLASYLRMDLGSNTG
jgi:hypothetical protein